MRCIQDPQLKVAIRAADPNLATPYYDLLSKLTLVLEFAGQIEVNFPVILLITIPSMHFGRPNFLHNDK